MGTDRQSVVTPHVSDAIGDHCDVPAELKANDQLSSLLVAGLLLLNAYPHAIDGPIVLHETHISWVFLAGDFAYKIKKPILNPFLDYSSLSKRHHACEEEIRLGKRYAKDLYLAVVPISLDAGRVTVNGKGQPIEFAVQLRRFEENSLMRNRLEANQVTVQEIENFARYLGSFHRNAEVPKSIHVPDIECILKQSIENFDYFRSVEAFAHDERLPKIEEWTRETFEKNKLLLDARNQSGSIRECHGDLHTDNIVFWKDELVPFDGIEFNRLLSNIDVINDLSFLIMDLHYRGYHDLAAVLLSTYLEQTGDYEGLIVLAWYSVYRAMVRAKVAAMRASQEVADSSPHKIHMEDANKHLQLAANFAFNRNQPRLWITHGFSGSGKSTGAMKLVLQESAIRIRSDVERKRLFANRTISNQVDIDSQSLYTSSVNDKTYSRLLELSELALRSGFSVVVDATFLQRKNRTRFYELAQSMEANFSILDFRASINVLRERIIRRAALLNDVSDATVEVLENQMETAEPLTQEEVRLAEIAAPQSE